MHAMELNELIYDKTGEGREDGNLWVRAGDQMLEVTDLTWSTEFETWVLETGPIPPPPEDPRPACSMCRRRRTLEGMDAYDYNPIQVISGRPLGWYSGDDGEVCPECMTKTVRQQ